MRLLESLQCFGALEGDPAIDERRNQSAEIVVQELQRAKRGLARFPAHIVDEAIDELLLKFLQGAARQAPSPVENDDVVGRKWLYVSLVNKVIERLRRERRYGELPSDFDPVEKHTADRDYLLAFVEDLQVQARSELVRDASANDETSIAQMFLIYDGRTTIDDLAASAGDSADVARGRNRLYAAHSRARRTALGRIAARHDRGEIDETLTGACVFVLHQLGMTQELIEAAGEKLPGSSLSSKERA